MSATTSVGRLDRRGRWVAAAVAAALFVVACWVVAQRQDDGPASAAPQAAADGQMVVDLRPPQREPALPEAAAAGTEEGAQQFVLYWFDVLNWSLATGDPDALVPWTGAGCGQCNGWLIGIARWRDSGTTLEGGLTVPTELAIGPFSTAEPVQFVATFLTTPATLTDAAGEPADYPGGATQGSVTVLWANERWQVTDVNLGTPPG